MSVYSVVSISKTTPPQGHSGDNWYCYVISSAHNTIVGYRRGPLREVKTVAQECVTHLNQKLHGVPARHFVRNAYPVADVDPITAA